MNARPLLIAFAVAALATALFAWYAGASSVVAIPSAIAAAGLATVAAVAPILEELGAAPALTVRAPPDAAVLLHDAFRSGPLGRETVLATLRQLEKGARVAGPPSTQDARWRAAPQKEFLRHVEDRLQRIENAL